MGFSLDEKQNEIQGYNININIISQETQSIL